MGPGNQSTPTPSVSSSINSSPGGVLSFALLRFILYTADPAQLRSLNLDNLLDLEQIYDGEDLPRGTDLSTVSQKFNANRIPSLRHPGPIRGHLRPLISRCTALQHLSLRSVSRDGPRDYFWFATKDKKRYAEAAAFIASVKATLRTFVFEQGLQPEDETDCWLPGRLVQCPMSETGRPADLRFIKYIVPVLTEDPRPKLREITIRDVGGRVRREVERWSKKTNQTLYEETYGKVVQVFANKLS